MQIVNQGGVSPQSWQCAVYCAAGCPGACAAVAWWLKLKCLVKPWVGAAVLAGYSAAIGAAAWTTV